MRWFPPRNVNRRLSEEYRDEFACLEKLDLITKNEFYKRKWRPVALRTLKNYHNDQDATSPAQPNASGMHVKLWPCSRWQLRPTDLKRETSCGTTRTQQSYKGYNQATHEKTQIPSPDVPRRPSSMSHSQPGHSCTWCIHYLTVIRAPASPYYKPLTSRLCDHALVQASDDK